jgi:uncharacterized membrane protein YczE
MELTIVTLGFLLKGPVGVGTLLMALSLGPAVQLAFTKASSRSLQLRLTEWRV